MNTNPISYLSSSLSQDAAPAPIHDIVGPVPFFPYTASQIMVTMLIFFLLLGGVGYFIWRSRRKRALTRKEAMLRALASLKKELMLGSDHDFGIRVSTLLRNYLSEAFSLAAPKQTTEEFLKSLHGQERFSLPEQEALSHFLRQSDVLKFAQGVAESEERLALINAAESFIHKGEEEKE